ncbi:MAG: hypothetical protein OEZ02_14380 [Anaerolineae bacterium]|nr:hypothetical protein [Anaerolineae bacterium]
MVLIIESPLEMVEGETISYSITWQGADSVSEPTAVIYKGGEDITATAMPGTHTVSGNIQSLPALTCGTADGGLVYVVVVQALVDGNTERRKFNIKIVKDEAE